MTIYEIFPIAVLRLGTMLPELAQDPGPRCLAEPNVTGAKLLHSSHSLCGGLLGPNRQLRCPGANQLKVSSVSGHHGPKEKRSSLQCLKSSLWFSLSLVRCIYNLYIIINVINKWTNKYTIIYSYNLSYNINTYIQKYICRILTLDSKLDSPPSRTVRCPEWHKGGKAGRKDTWGFWSAVPPPCNDDHVWKCLATWEMSGNVFLFLGRWRFHARCTVRSVFFVFFKYMFGWYKRSMGVQ